ncbi:hypothetical protein [Nocardioides luti]|uniref:hypothetical protein n=1 Tax=Nocardioides luti TaxID=2761101 RepID=UPI0031B589AC
MADQKSDSKADAKAAKAAAKAEAREARGKRAEERSGGGVKAGVSTLRTRVAQVVWLVFVVAALFLAVGALLIALDANRDNGLVKFILDGANTVDLGIFSRNNGIKDFTGNNADVKNALFNWGIGAIVWLVVGRVLERIIRP